MRQWLEGMRWKMQNWMQGRYGRDELSRFSYWVSLILLLISCFIRNYVGQMILLVAVVIMAWNVFRMTSKRVDKRYAELQRFEKMIAAPRSFFQRQMRRWQDRKTHCYFKCPCGQTLRVPKGRGKIEITCPKCKTVMVRKT